MSATLTKPFTAEQLLALPDDGWRYELVKGELLRMAPTGEEHGVVTMGLAAALHRYVKDNRLGRVYAAETGFKLESNPDTVRAPDIAFVSAERITKTGLQPGYRYGAPDLAVEVLSPSDRPRKIIEKVRNWFEGGAQAVWVINPKQRNVIVYRSLEDFETLVEGDSIKDEKLLPGFTIAVADVFA